jgi:hypothetical protein
MEDQRGAGWLLFAGIIISIAGALNLAWGIAAVSDSHLFDGHGRFIFEGLHAWGWVTIVLGAIQLLAALSIWRGGIFGQVFGIFAASLSAVGALLSIAGYPLWSICIFAVDMLIIYGLAAYGGRRRVAASG